MKRLLWGCVFAVLLVAGSLAIQPPKASAAEGFNIITSPLPIKLSTSPGQTVETELRLKNQGTEPEDIKVSLMKFGATGDTGQPNLFDLTPKDTYASWVHFTPSQFTAQPNVWISVKMTIQVPTNAQLGYYLAVTFSRANQAGIPDATTVNGSVATLVLLDVKSGNEKRNLKLLSFTSDHGLYEYLPANFKVKLQNPGNIYLAPAGNIFIQRGGKAVSVLDLNDAGGSILPGSNRIFSIPWKDGFPVYTNRLVDQKTITDSHGLLEQNLKWDFTQTNKFRIGRYTARLQVVYDNGQEDVPLEATLSFWVLPWKLMLAGLVVVALIGFAIFSLFRKAVGKTRRGLGKYRGRKS